MLENSYSFTDSEVIVGITYYYILEDIDTGGNVNRHGPIEITAERGGKSEISISALFLLCTILLLGLNQIKGTKFLNSDVQSVD
jgi:hypothetical protein